jgi:hypothetical protein
MHQQRVAASLIVLLVTIASACTAPATAPNDSGIASTGRIVGLTENRYCGGPVSPSGCTSPYSPSSDLVTIVPHIPAVDPLLVKSGSDGSFTADLLPGEWAMTANPISPGGDTDCPPVTVTVIAGSTVHVELRCTIELP